MINVPITVSVQGAVPVHVFPSGTPFSLDGAVRYDVEQNLTNSEQEQARDNVSAAEVITDTASGNIVNVPDGAGGMSVRGLVVDVDPVQDLHGYSNPWPAGGGKNLFQTTLTTQTVNGKTFTVNSDGSVTVSGTPTANISTVSFGTITLPAGTYKVNGFSLGASGGTRMAVRNDTTDTSITNIYTDRDIEFTLTEESAVRLYPVIMTSFTDTATFYPMIRLSSVNDATFAPYSNICPISGRTGANLHHTSANLLGGNALRDAIQSALPAAVDYPDDRYITFTGGADVSDTITGAAGIAFKTNTQYTFIMTIKKLSVKGSNLRVKYTDGTTSSIPAVAELGVKETVIRQTSASKTVAYLEKVNSGATTYLYYDECGIFEGVLTTADFEPYVGTAYPVTWQSEAGTVYGGTVDVVSGLLTVTRGYSELDENWTWVKSGTYQGGYYTSRPQIGYKTNTPFICTHAKTATSLSEYVYGTCYCDGSMNIRIMDANSTLQDWKDYIVAQRNNGTPIAICYELATPQTYQLTPTEVALLAGVNNIFSDGGSVTLEYPCDTKLYIEKLTKPTEDDMVANANIANDTYFMVGNNLFLSTAAIAAGNTIQVGVNCASVSLPDALNALKSL